MKYIKPIQVRFTIEQHSQIVKRASKQNKTVSTYIRKELSLSLIGRILWKLKTLY